MVKIISVENYKYGVVNSLEAKTVPRGSASDSLNWMTMGDHIELRRGMKFLGDTSVNTGNGKVSGLKKVTDAASVEHLIGSYGQKLVYFDRTTEEWLEFGTNILGSAVVDADGIASEDIFICEYVSPAGYQVWVNSPNIDKYLKIMTANLANESSRDLYDADKNFKGNLKIDTNRTLLWGRTKDKTGLYGSFIDIQNFTTVSGEAFGTGDAVTKHFTHTAAASATSPRTIFGVSVTAGAITLTDDYNGILSASDGSSGTIDYVTGAMVVDFFAAPGGAVPITVDYQWENSNDNGISDFTKSGTRVAGEGFIFRQDEGGGPIQNVSSYNQSYFCFHVKKTWELILGTDDTSAINLPYREKVGIPNVRAAVETGDGIYYIDDTDTQDPKVRLLTYDRSGSQQVIPVAKSNNLDLNGYLFDKTAAIEYGDFVIFSCRQSGSPQNDRTLVINKLWKAWDILDYCVSCFEVYDGALVAGDSISNNFCELFSGYDDLGANINNYWIGNVDGFDAEGLKKYKKMYMAGLIHPDQKLEVYLSADGGPFVLAYTIDGKGDYVDKGESVAIGAPTLGRTEVGGGSNGDTAHPYEILFPVSLGKFETLQVEYVATEVGYVSVSSQKFWDVRTKSRSRVPLKYRA